MNRITNGDLFSKGEAKKDINLKRCHYGKHGPVTHDSSTNRAIALDVIGQKMKQ